MDILNIDPNALIILVIMIIGGLKWFLERLKGAQEEEDGSPTTFEDLYEETRREIQERQSRQSPPAEQADRDQRPVVFEPLSAPPAPPPLPAASVPTPTAVVGPNLRPVKRPTLSKAEKEALARVQERQAPGRHSRGRRTGQSKVRQLLASPSAARDAIVLREILGPPKGEEQG